MCPTKSSSATVLASGYWDLLFNGIFYFTIFISFKRFYNALLKCPCHDSGKAIQPLRWLESTFKIDVGQCYGLPKNLTWWDDHSIFHLNGQCCAWTNEREYIKNQTEFLVIKNVTSTSTWFNLGKGTINSKIFNIQEERRSGKNLLCWSFSNSYFT